MPVLVLIQIAIVLIAIATIVLGMWLANDVTVRAIVRPTGAYTIPYDTHGGTVFISQSEHIEMILWWIVTALLMGTQLWLNRARLRSKT